MNVRGRRQLSANERPRHQYSGGRSRTLLNRQRSLRDREAPGSNPGPPTTFWNTARLLFPFTTATATTANRSSSATANSPLSASVSYSTPDSLRIWTAVAHCSKPCGPVSSGEAGAELAGAGARTARRSARRSAVGSARSAAVRWLLPRRSQRVALVWPVRSLVPTTLPLHLAVGALPHEGSAASGEGCMPADLPAAST